MLVHIEVTEQSNCETTAPKSDILVKINMEACQFHLKSREIVLSLIFHSLSFLKLHCRTLVVIRHESNISEKQIVWLIIVTGT